MGEGYRRRDTAGELALYHLNALAAEGKVGRTAGKPRRRYWQEDADTTA